MTENDYEKILIEYIAEQVINKINENQKRALLLFTGANLGFESSIRSLHLLKNDGWKFQCVMSKEALKVLNKNIVQELSSKEIIMEESSVELKKTIKNFNIVIIPVLSINTASKIVNLISDNLITNIISGSINRGKVIIACINACSPDSEDRIKMGLSANNFYNDKLRSNLNILQQLGINLTVTENLYNIVSAKAHKNIDFLNHKGNAVFIKDKVINKGCILNNKNYSIIKTNKDSVITELAIDEAKKLNITIIKE